MTFMPLMPGDRVAFPLIGTVTVGPIEHPASVSLRRDDGTIAMVLSRTDFDTYCRLLGKSPERK